MKRSAIVLCLFYGAQMNVFSQSLYSLDLKKDIIIGALSLGIGVSPFFISNEPENAPEIASKKMVNLLDRSLMFSYNKPLDIISDYAPYGLALLPVISLIPNINHAGTLLTYGVMYSEALLLTYGMVFGLKKAVIRYRPYMYATGVPAGKEKDYYNSFPSGAASFAFLSAAFLSATFSREFPGSKWKFPVIIGSHIVAAGIGSMRVSVGSHFLTDVFAGAAIGSLCGWLLPWLHIKTGTEKYTIVPLGNGLMVSLRL